MHKQLQANSKFLMSLYPREVIPLFQLPDSLGVLIMVVRYIHPPHTPPTHTMSTYMHMPNAYHTHTHKHIPHTHAAYHTYIFTHYIKHTPYNSSHMPLIRHTTRSYVLYTYTVPPHLPHTHTHTYHIIPTHSQHGPLWGDFSLLIQPAPHSWDGTCHYILSLLLPPAQFYPGTCILSRE